MDKVAALSNEQRRELFDATAGAMGIHPAVAEKDFWVCWVLKKLFASPQLQGQLVFKGGTSLSKVFKLIQRFSEDIDLVLNWELLGYGKGGQDPWAAQPSGTRQDAFNREFNRRAAVYMKDVLLPQLTALFAVVPGIEPILSDDDPNTIDVRYPAAFKLAALRPQVKLEIGPLASWVPTARYTIQPFAAEHFGQVFADPACPVVAIKAERTFWEKATILHQQAHRVTVMPANYSRHYYDLHQLAGSPVKAVALADLKLLADVVAFKQRFYPSAWAKYEDARPGTFRLLPPEARGGELEADYRQMQEMIFGKAPAWTDILASLKNLEAEINTLIKPGAAS